MDFNNNKKKAVYFNLQEINQEIEINKYYKLSKTLSLIENQHQDYLTYLCSLPLKPKPIIGLSGPPGVGKSSLGNKMVSHLATEGYKIAVLCFDPSSPNNGSILGDRLRFIEAQNHPNVYIRSFSNRGTLGGLNKTIWEICWYFLACSFDYIFIETIGVGQNEVDIAQFANPTIIILSPDNGDEIQIMKSGLMEIANIFIVNKFDHPEANKYFSSLKKHCHELERKIPIIKAIANQTDFDASIIINVVFNYIQSINLSRNWTEFLSRIVYKIIFNDRMKGLSPLSFVSELNHQVKTNSLCLQKIIDKYSL